MLRRYLLATVVLGAMAAVPVRDASALVFNFATKSGDTLTPDQAAAFQTAGNAWSAVLSDRVTVNLTIGFNSALSSGVLGTTVPTLYAVNYDAARSALVADAKTTYDATAVASLPATEAGPVLLTTAQGRAIGLSSIQANDAVIEFNSNYKFASTRNADGSVAGDSYDLIGIAEHEIGHALGFVSNLDVGATSGGASDRTILDLFRYSAPGSPSYAKGASAYFSIDSGTTNLAAFSDGVSDQASHWVNNLRFNGSYAVMDPEGNLGKAINVTALDAEALDVIGWDGLMATAVPEPLSLLLLLPAVLATVGSARGRMGRARA